MANQTAKLTKRVVDALRPEASRYLVGDASLPGFAVRVSPSGAKTYCLHFSLGGRKRWLTLGAHGPVTTEEARRLAMEARGRIARGEDPAQERQARKAQPLMTDLMDRFEQEHLPRKRPSTQVTYRCYLDHDLRPRLGGIRVRELSSDHVAKLHRDLRATPTKANRVFAILSKMLNLAEVWGYRDQGSNPCTLLRRNELLYPEKVRHEPLDEAGAAQLGSTLARLEREGHLYPPAACALRLILLTGSRRQEILEAQWSWLQPSADGGLDLRLPTSKTGAKVVHLNAMAVEEVERLRSMAVAGNPYLVPGLALGKPFQGMGKVWERVRREAGFPTLRIHDLRHTFGAALGAVEANAYKIQALLHHAHPATTARYARPNVNPLRVASEQAMAGLGAALKTGR